jgi:RecA/RadA recombinase
MMHQKLILKSAIAQTTIKPFAFSVPSIDVLFPGFKAGDFAVVYGPQTVTSLMSKLCLRAQLPDNHGGLDSNVVFIDTATSASIKDILDTAEHLGLEPKAALKRVTNMRAYTAYRLTSIITEKLQEAVETSNAKLVVISDIGCSFLSDNVDDQEARAVYSQIMSYLSNFAKKHRIIIVATYLSHESNQRNSILQEITNQKATSVLRFTKTPYTSEVELEKHPSYMLGVVDYIPEPQAVNDYSTSTNVETSLTYNIL